MSEGRTYECVLRLRYPSAQSALIAKTTLEVDMELQPHRISKVFELSDSQLLVRFTTQDPKLLRVAISSFCDMASVVSRTLLEFDTSV